MTPCALERRGKSAVEAGLPPGVRVCLAARGAKARRKRKAEPDASRGAGWTALGYGGAALRVPDGAAKIRDVVGLYLDPPEKAVVLSIDEKSQIQALGSTGSTPALSTWAATAGCSQLTAVPGDALGQLARRSAAAAARPAAGEPPSGSSSL